MKEDINVFDYASEIMNGLKQGVLLTTKANEKTNTMTISWGHLGIEWEKQIFVVYVRENRFTKQQLDANPEFTINIPMGNFNKKILGIAGTKTGAKIDKIKTLGLSLEAPKNITVPGICELPLTLECKVIYKQRQDKTAITPENNNKFYPQDVDASYHGANKDYHTMYYGEIVAAYIIK